MAELFGQQGVPAATSLDGALLVASLIINVFVVVHERRRGRELSSTLLMADASHTASDILVTGLAMGSLVLSRLGYQSADAQLGVLVALIIAWSGYQILRNSIPVLVDARGVAADRLADIVRTIPGVKGVRAARSRRTSSGHLFAEVTILVDGKTSARRRLPQRTLSPTRWSVRSRVHWGRPKPSFTWSRRVSNPANKQCCKQLV